MKIAVIIAAHKNFYGPKDRMYIPVHRGRRLKRTVAGGAGNILIENIVGDDTGKNISCKNGGYCELTCLYWAVNNIKADYIGLCHYRRYFKGLTGRDELASVLGSRQAQALLKKCPVILPQKRHYFIETNYSQYIHAHHRQDLELTQDIIRQMCPQYLPAWEKVMAARRGHRFNMFIMPMELAQQYCRWLFGILFSLEERLDVSSYSTNDKRVFGFVAERLLDVWIETNDIHYTELPVINTQGENWPVKIAAFMKRKFFYKGE